jgi:ribosomal protein S8
LNKTVSKMISAKNSMHLLDLLQRTGIIREFLRPSKEVKAKQEFALQSMKETYERLEKRTFRDQA